MAKTKVKICGITSLGDALTACDYGADALGFILYDRSPRYINPGQVAQIIRRLPVFVSTVGVFVDASIDTIRSIVAATGLDYVQLHGNEPLDMVHELGTKAIKAFRIKDASSIREVNASGLRIVLLDSATSRYGGSGRSFDHALLQGLSPDIRYILSGGITPDNVCELVNTFNPEAIDVSSGVETAPGRKSGDKMKLLFGRLNGCTVHGTGKI